MNVGDKLLLGVDLKKSADIILPAYNDAAGFTRDFNLNLLTRINRELDANFDLSKFNHKPFYNEEEGIAYSFIESQVTQDVTIKSISKTYHFDKEERIHTEISRKYDDETIDHIFAKTSLVKKKVFKDSQNLFADYLFEKEAL